LNLFVVRKLVISESLQEKGFVCRAHHYIALEEGECPFDGTKLLPVENVTDEIVEIARTHGVQLMAVERRQELLAKCQGIAGLLYPGTNPK